MIIATSDPPEGPDFSDLSSTFFFLFPARKVMLFMNCLSSNWNVTRDITKSRIKLRSSRPDKKEKKIIQEVDYLII